jgi:hypothetical protein
MTIEERFNEFPPGVRLALFEVLVVMFHHGSNKVKMSDVVTLFGIHPIAGDDEFYINLESEEFGIMFDRWHANLDVCGDPDVNPNEIIAQNLETNLKSMFTQEEEEILADLEEYMQEKGHVGFEFQIRRIDNNDFDALHDKPDKSQLH